MASGIVPLSVENCNPGKNTPVIVLNGGVMSAEHVGALFQTGIFCLVIRYLAPLPRFLRPSNRSFVYDLELPQVRRSDISRGTVIE